MCVCDFTQMCVADTCRHVCCGRGCRCDLAACRFFARKRTYTHTHTHVRAGLRRKQRTQAMASDCAHVHVCCRSKASVVHGDASCCLDCVVIAHARSRLCVIEKQGAEATMSQVAPFVMFVYTCFVAKRCVWESRKCGFSKPCVLDRHLYCVVVIACGRSREPVVSDVAHTHVCFRSTKSGITVPACVCQRCHINAHMCVANACAARTWVHVISHTHAHGLCRESGVSVRTPW